ncbi:MAG: YraN family protein [Clostridiales bacterium]|jgi:putative endonuclease|nr:YraN family protein [Clostridiales bacterium]
MPGESRREGISGECDAAKFLEAKGYKILDKNFSGRHGEIDIVAKHGDYIVFVEVKSRLNEKFGRPIESVTPYKMQCIIETAKFYATVKGCIEMNMRFDVIEILRGEITHTVNAFDLSDMKRYIRHRR